MTAHDDERPQGVYLVRSQAQLEWLSLVRIPLALAVLLGTLGVLLWGAFAAMRALDVRGDFTLKAVTLVSFAVALYAANRAASKVPSRGPKTVVAVGPDEVRYGRPNGDRARFANRGVAIVSVGPNKLEVQADGARHVLPRSVVLDGDSSPAFYQLDVVGERLVVARVSMAAGSTDILPFE